MDVARPLERWGMAREGRDDATFHSSQEAFLQERAGEREKHGASKYNRRPHYHLNVRERKVFWRDVWRLISSPISSHHAADAIFGAVGK